MPSKALLIILDGCRPDAIHTTHTPRLDSLWQTGAYTWSARTIMPSVTLPSHNTMFRSIAPEKHGVKADNIHKPSAQAFPSIIDVAKLNNKSTAMIYSWEQLRDLNAPGSTDFTYCANAIYGVDNDTAIATTAAAYITDKRPDMAVLYLGDIDIMGHLYGWMSAEQLAALELNDKAVGIVLDALDRSGLRNDYTILVQADHGGHETDHGTDMPEDMTIPWFVNGPGVKRGYAIQGQVNIRDTAPTLAHILGIPQPDHFEGQPVHEAFES